MLQLSTIKRCAKVRGQCTCNDNVLNYLFRTTVTHGHFDMGYSESTFSKYAWEGGGVTKKSMLCTLVKMMTIMDDPLCLQICIHFECENLLQSA